MLRSIAALLILSLPWHAAAAQGVGWDLPHRGAITFTRSTEKFAVTAPPTRMNLQWAIAGSDQGGHDWRYFAGARGGVPAGFEAPAFDDRDWPVGKGEFGAEPPSRTRWVTPELGLRTRVDLGRKRPKAIVLRVQHDDGVRIWLNGKQVAANDGVGRDRTFVVSGDALDAWVPGENVLAARCVNTGGAQYLDIALACVPALPPGVRGQDDVLRLYTEEQQAVAAVRRDLFPNWRPPPLLLQGELDTEQQRVLLPPTDLRELGWWVATDLSRGVVGGAYQADAYRMFRLGDLQLRGRAGEVDAGGWQAIEVTVKTAPDLAQLDDSKRFVSMHVRPHVVFGFDGRLLVRRRVELRGNRARVGEFRTELTGRILRGKDWKDQAADIEQIETWKPLLVIENQDATFRQGVGAALKKGTATLRSLLGNPSGYQLEPQPADGDRSYNSGRLALGLLALLKSGLPKDDDVVQRGLAELRTRPLIDTYSLGNALMALEASHAPPNEFLRLKDGAIDRPQKRELPPADRELMAKWTARLLTNIDTRVDPAHLLRFNYIRGERFDHSVNQYGVLGLYSAHLCGVELPATTWEAAANHWIAAQTEGSRRVDLDLCDYRTQARRRADPDFKRTTARSPVLAAGWNYEDPKQGGENSPVFGSMTCAGITGLAICQAAMLDQNGGKRTRLFGDCSAARNRGFAWLAEHMTFRYHPGTVWRQQTWFYYYLYGLERAALLSGIALIQDRDWYFEGAMMLIHSQQPDGSWPGVIEDGERIERDAMAILFLKQGTLPVLTGQ